MKGSATPKPDRPVSATYLGGLLGVSDRTVRDLAQRGVLSKAGDGQYPIRASVTAYCAHLREQAAGRASAGPTSSLTAERQRLVTAQADRAELANRVRQAELVEAAEVEAEWSSIAAALRARLLAVPSRVQQRLAHLTAAEVAGIDREVRDALTELGTGDQTMPATRANLALGGD